MEAAYKFVHPGTVKQGYLVKSPPLDKKIKLDGWRKRWCVFTITEQDPSLDYYKDEEEALSTLPIKRISLINCYQVVSDMKHKQRKHIFALHLPERVYYFSAPSHVEMMEWVQAFCTNLNLCHSDGGTLPATPPMSRPDDVRKSMTMPASPNLKPRSRAPDSPLPPIPSSRTPPIPRSPELGRPKLPDIPVPLIPLEVYPSVSPSTSPLLMARSVPSPNLRQGEENELLSHSEGTKVVISVDEPPPVPPPHRVLKSTKSSSDEDDEEPLSPPPPPPRRVSPVPSLSSPPMSPPFEMDVEFPPTPPPRPVTDSPSHPVLVTTELIEN